jgi:hypothetical protein
MSLEEGRTEDEARRFLEAQPPGEVTNGTIMRAIQHGYAVRVEETLRNKLAAVLACGIGFGFSILGKLHVYSLENGGFEVTEDFDVPGAPTKTVSLGEFESPTRAVEVLLRRRHELKLGFDYEKEPR